MNENKPHTRIEICQTIKVSSLAFALIVGHLLAINGRYSDLDDDYFDNELKR